jgi:methionyl-tRNA formyltransferase
LKKEVLEAARWGGINVHGSLLPKYRGAAPVAHAILNCETTTGVTIIRMTTGLDAGDMLAQAPLEIGPDETAGELEARLAPLGAQLAVEVIHKARESGGVSPLPATKQDPALVTKAPKLKKEDGLIDWSQPAGRVARQVRAMQPWPTAYTFLQRAGGLSLRVIISKAAVSEPPALAGGEEQPTSPANAGGSPGAVLVSGQQFVALTGTGTVKILELQPAGKKRMTAAEFLRGYQLQPGDCFSSKSE